jgi:GT2 family glycosyltransferase
MITRNDDPALLAEVLDAIAAQDVGNRTLVVDMSTSEGVRSVCTERTESVRYVPAPDSRGISDSRNRVVAHVTTRYLAFIDADAVPHPGWASALRAAFNHAPDTAVVGARCVARWTDRPPRLFTTAFAGDFLSLFDLGDEPLDVPRIVGTSHAIDLKRVPPAPFSLDLGYAPGRPLGGDEVDLCERVIRDGCRVRYEPSAVVSHVIKPGRATWGEMFRRAFHAGQEARLLKRRLDPLPRSPTAGDRVFQAAIAPAFVVGMAAPVRSPERTLQ